MFSRVTSLVLFVIAVLAPLTAAEIHVHYDTGWGNRISIRGTGPGLSWFSGQDAAWSSGNVWVYETPETGDGFEFKPLINDTQWSTGANYEVPSNDAVVHVYPFFGQSQGTLVVIEDFDSSMLGYSRDLRIFLPASYDENLQKDYPVVYMHDAQNLFSAATAGFGVEWQVDETVDDLVQQGLIEEAIYVGLDNTFRRMSEYTPTVDANYGGGDGDAYLDMLVQEVIPYIESNYRVRAGAANRVLMGSSLGGLISFYGAWSRPDVFGKAAAMSASFWWDAQEMVDQVAQATGPLPDAAFYIDAGGNESQGLVDGVNAMKAALVAQGYVFGERLWHSHATNGGHNEASWAARLDLPLRVLLPWQ